MNGTDRLVEIAKLSMQSAVTLGVELERQRYQIWKAQPPKGKKPFEPMADTAGICMAFQDFFTTAIDSVRVEAKKDAKDGV